MKKILKIIFTTSILIFLILWILMTFVGESKFNTMEIRSILVIIYLISSLIYYKMDVKDKNAEIQQLKQKLKEKYDNN
jgi:magnesium-transporting ATPase (P-type)